MFSFISNFKQHCLFRSSHPELFLGKGAPKIRSKFTGEHSCRSAISIKLLCNIIKIALRHGCSPVNLLHIFRTPFLKNIPEWLLLYIMNYKRNSERYISLLINFNQCYTVILRDNVLCIPPKNKMSMFSFPSLILK